MARRRNSAWSQAAADAQLQYGPQRRDLHSQLADAGAQRTNDVRAAQASGGALAHYIRGQLGTVAGDYGQAARLSRGFQGNLLNDLKGLGGAATPFAAAALSENAGANEMAAQELANAKGSFRGQANQALQGAVNDVANVRSNYASLAGKIRSQLTGLSADQAKFVAAEVPKLQQQAATNARLSRAAADAHRAAQDAHRAATQKRWLSSPTGGGLLDSVASAFGGKGGIAATVGKLHAGPKLTPAQSGSALSQINQAVAVMQQAQHAGQHVDPTFFLTGYRGKKGEVSIPKIGNAGPIRNTVLLKSALDLYQHNRLSPDSYNALYGVQGIPREWRPPGPSELRRVRRAFPHFPVPTVR